MTAVSPTTIVHVDLADAPGAFRDLRAEPGCDAVLAVFRWRGRPLASRLFTAGELPVPATALPALAAAAVAPRLIAHGVDDPDDLPRPSLPADGPAISVVICTRDRPQELERCLASLSRCDPAPAEIVVVDNAPGGAATPRIAARYGARCIAEWRPGLSRARNTGIAAAGGEVIAFTDDDVEVAEDWLAPLGAAFADPAVAAVTGLVLPARLDSPASAAFELIYGGLAGSFESARFDPPFLDQPLGEAPPVWRIGAGANLALRRAALDRAGPFDERLGAGAAGCSEDSEMMHRLLLGGWSCLYDPRAVVYHTHRCTLPALRRQLRAYMRGHVAALLVQFGSSRRPGNLVRAFIGLPVYFVLAFLATFWRREPLRRRLLPWEVLGLVEGWAALLRYRRPAPSSPPPASAPRT